MDVIFSGIVLFILLGLIVLACVIFTNAIEHLGEQLNLSEGAVGSILAAVGTALPETIVPIVAIAGAYLFNGDIESSGEIGIGAILGAPFLLGTAAFFITGLAVYIYTYKGKRTLLMPVNTSVMKRDMKYFMLGYLVAITASFIQIFIIKVLIALILLGLYSYYVYMTIKDSSKSDVSEEELPSLYLARFFGFSLPIIIIQVVISILAIIVLAHFFVENLNHISCKIHISPLILSLIITPIATELPEKFNSVIWIRAQKDTLALGNITGAMVFQSCLPPIIGILFTPWVLDSNGYISIILVYISVILVYLNLHFNKNVLKPWILLISGIFYLLYIIYLVAMVIPNQPCGV